MAALKKEALPELLSLWAKKRTVYLPQTEGWRCFAGDADFSRDLPRRGLKELFLPQTEDMMSFVRDGKKLTVLDARQESEDCLIFGAKACDLAAVERLDEVFLSEPKDTFYEERRNRAAVITLCCAEPAQTCFCSLFGVDMRYPGGDIACWEDEDSFYFRGNTPLGEALLAEGEALFTQEKDGVIDALAQTAGEKLAAMPLTKLDLSAFGAGKTEELFDRQEWKTLSDHCMACGVCTFLCPTCQCYDIRDFDDGRQIRRFRCWDSCMYADFTQMSAGQPRPTQKERFRQRFLHKLVYFPTEHQGRFGCVGCGRCVKACPQHLHVGRVIKALGGKAHE